MSKRLILMRHAKSDWSHGLEDHDRPLNERGWQAAKMIGNWLRLNDYIPDEILCSTATRTRETFEQLKLNAPVRYMPELYLAEPEQILDAVKSAEGNTLLVIGHNPGIAWFANQSAESVPDHPKFESYPTCATSILDFEIDSWSKIRNDSGRFADFVTPRELVQ